MLLDINIQDFVGESNSWPLLGKFLWYADLKGAAWLEEQH
jgi:hypothetical protein